MMRQKQPIKRLFTLLEMMVALMILGLIGAVTAIQVKKLLNDHRFEKEVSELFIALQEAQVLSATYQTDLALNFFQKQGKWYYRLSTDEPFKVYQFNSQEIPLEHIAQLKFTENKKPPYHFAIYAGGRIEPRGVLTFYQSKEEDSKRLWFDLQYGHLLKYAYTQPAKEASP